MINWQLESYGVNIVKNYIVILESDFVSIKQIYNKIMW